VRSSEVSDETIRERLAELEEAYELATYYSRCLCISSDSAQATD
jgi:hypothetical protein